MQWRARCHGLLRTKTRSSQTGWYCSATGSTGRQSMSRATKFCGALRQWLLPSCAQSRTRRVLRLAPWPTLLPNSKLGTSTSVAILSGRCLSKNFRSYPLSRSEPVDSAGDFGRWLTREFAQSGAFTALVVLVEIAGTRVTPLCSTFFNVIGDEIDWSDIVDMFDGSGREWDGAAFFPTAAP